MGLLGRAERMYLDERDRVHTTTLAPTGERSRVVGTLGRTGWVGGWTWCTLHTAHGTLHIAHGTPRTPHTAVVEQVVRYDPRLTRALRPATSLPTPHTDSTMIVP